MSLVATSIARRASAITPSDTADNSHYYIYVGGAGDVKVTTEFGDVVTYTVAAGTFLWIRTRLVWATGTTATLMVGHR